jgi:calcium channel MID1
MVFLLIHRTAFCFLLLSYIDFVYSQLVRQTLGQNSLTSLTAAKLTGSHAFDLPASDDLSISIALCGTSLTNNAPFYITNDTQQDINAMIQNGAGSNVWELAIQDGYGNWTGPARDGAILAFKSSNSSVEIGVSNNG